MRRTFPRLLVFAVLAASPALAQGVLKQEPPMGALRLGQRVLVDDDSCPKGQIKEVIGGNHVKAGGHGQTVRTRRCIKR